MVWFLSLTWFYQTSFSEEKKKKKGMTALHEAVYQGNINLASLILTHIKGKAEKKEKGIEINNQLGARIGMRNSYPMNTLTKERNNKELADYKKQKNILDKDGLSVLHYAVMSDGIDRAENVVAALLKDKDIDTDEQDKFGETPFQLAIRLGRDRVVETVLFYLFIYLLIYLFIYLYYLILLLSL